MVCAGCHLPPAAIRGGGHGEKAETDGSAPYPAALKKFFLVAIVHDGRSDCPAILPERAKDDVRTLLLSFRA